MREETFNWLSQAKEDYNTAQYNLDGGIYYASVFFAQQAAEKSLKALFIEVNREEPPKTHSMVRLARSLSAPEEIMEAAADLNPEYFSTRYPDAAVGIPAEMYTRKLAERHLRLAEKVVQWVESLLRSSDSSGA